MPLMMEALAEVQVRRVGQQPELTGSLDNLDSATDSLSRVAELADRLGPTVERLEMLLPGDPDRLAGALAAGDERLHDLLAEVRATAEALNGTLETANRVAASVELPAGSLEALESGEIQAALREVSIALEHLEAVVTGAERLLDSEELAEVAPQLGAALDRVSGAGENLIDQAFVAGVKLIVVFLIGVLLVLLAYRYLSTRV
jgi:hypothetical protein